MTDSPEIITFLFTDIQGSTQLWEQHPEAMKLALARHDSIVRQAIEAHGGHVFKTGGDAFCAAFPHAPAAVLAALDAQRALYAESWGATVIRVRMGLHSGIAEQRDNDYFGPLLNRVARLMSAGHGGQTLLSAATKDLLQNQLPAGVDLRDMGERRLKDLARPEHIYQLLAPDLPAEFPPLKTLDSFRTNLPAQLTSFIGREKEIAAIKQLVRDNRLTTLTGPGGTGKSRLSLQVASTLLDSFPDGVWFIELASLADPALVPKTIMTTLGLREDNGRSPLEILNGYLHTKTALLILDNCEHLIEASAQLTEALLHGSLYLHILTSSRESLGITGEIPFRVPSLSIPDKHQTLETSRQYEAVRLFVDRAQTSQPSFTLTETNAFAVAQICARLDGIPLAIELAAARVKLLKVEQVAERLDDRFRLLTGGSRTALPRQQTLRAMIDWSYDLLSEPERTLLRRLSVFAGGWTLEAVEAVGKDEGKSKDGFLQPSSLRQAQDNAFILHPSYFILDTLDQLVNKSLIVVDADERVETRYHLLETVRQYAREKLFETGEGMSIRDLHLQYFLNLAERARSELLGPRIAEWLQRLDAEIDNLRAALEWSLERDALPGLRLLFALDQFWDEAGHNDVAYHWLPQLISRPEVQARTSVRARALIAQVEMFTLNVAQLNPTLEEALSIYRELDDQAGIALTLRMMGEFADVEWGTARALFLESLSICKSLGDKEGMVWALNDLGDGQRNLQDAAQTAAYLNECLSLCREIGFVRMQAFLLYQLGLQAFWQGENVTARAWFNESLAIQNQLGKKSGSALALLNALGQLALREGNHLQAATYFEESLIRSESNAYQNHWARAGLAYIALRQGDMARARMLFDQSQFGFNNETVAQEPVGVIYTLEGLASLTVLQQRFAQAAQIFAWADAARKAIAYPRPAIEQTDIDRDLAIVHAQLDAATLATAYEAGCAMSMDEAIAFALQATVQ